MDRNYSLDIRTGVWATVQYEDLDARNWLKGHGYKWSSANKAWNRQCAIAAMASEVEVLREMGFRLETANPTEAAKTVARFNLPVPCPVRVWLGAGDRWSRGQYEIVPDAEQAGWNQATVVRLSAEWREAYQLKARS